VFTGIEKANVHDFHPSPSPMRAWHKKLQILVQSDRGLNLRPIPALTERIIRLANEAVYRDSGQAFTVLRDSKKSNSYTLAAWFN